MNKSERTARSKRLAFLLRHSPESAGLSLDREGWAPVGAVLAALELSRADLEELVRLDAKGRYQFEGQRVRAVQGHSTAQVDREFEEREPPERLFHGTTSAVLDAILAEGLRPMDRHWVHLSPDEKTARAVGSRHVKRGAKLVVLAIDAAAMRRDGERFYLAENGVWLVASVLPRYLSPIAGTDKDGIASAG